MASAAIRGPSARLTVVTGGGAQARLRLPVTSEGGDIKASGPEPDKFRITVWDKSAGDAAIYDNKIGASDDIDAADPQELGGGSIVIHDGGNGKK